MTYREKTAWLTLAAMVLTFVPYFGVVASGAFDETALPNLPLLTAFAGVALAQVVILGIGHGVLRWRFPGDAAEPADERDRAIEQRSTRWAYYALITGMIVVGCVLPFSAGGWEIVNAALLAILVAEVVHYGVAIAAYRRHA
jgi:hypothetical protein